ncbi:MAG: hypothetical protein A3J45_06420 [Candidatus Rokubacteria bacterium RIFCSPHIGHO2_02_FULL_69_13]|nr:MAG: hypothetical protein A3J45_06420 [Candidatus Rokubacteria bacterium RIFCSPHIGHO2_02_FULL_69_13]
MVMRLLAVLFPALALAVPAFAEEWSRARIDRLPDSAFAFIEITEDSTRLRHLPHHDERGAVDVPHLKSALSRIGQVRWLYPEGEAAARRHLEEHLRELRRQERSSGGRR